MIDREKVINALEDYEPYAREFDSLSVYGWVVLDALTLLKEIEPVQSGVDADGVPHCGSCGWIQSYGCKYCDNCGKRLFWE